MLIDSVAVHKPVSVWIDDPDGTFPTQTLGSAVQELMPGNEAHIYRPTVFLDKEKSVYFEGDVFVISPDVLTPEEIDAAIDSNDHIKAARGQYAAE
jgi:hypothetical protein